MDAMEIEVKFFLSDLKSVREKLVEMGAEGRGRYFESNIRFEDPEKSLIQKKCLLRLRRDNRVRLTFKKESPEKDSNFKIYKELEVEVGDFETMKGILNFLGFFQEQKYEKYRETMMLGSTVFCLDEMPFGDFLEIEGEKKNIPMLADALNLDWDKRILYNYLNIFEILRREENLHFKDLTFENFRGSNIDFSRRLYLFTRQ